MKPPLLLFIAYIVSLFSSLSSSSSSSSPCLLKYYQWNSSKITINWIIFFFSSLFDYRNGPTSSSPLPAGWPVYQWILLMLLYHCLLNLIRNWLSNIVLILSEAVNTPWVTSKPEPTTKLDSTWPIFHLFASHRFRISPNWSYNEPMDIHRRYIGQRKPEYEHHHNIRRQIPNIITCNKIGCSRPNSTNEFF